MSSFRIAPHRDCRACPTVDGRVGAFTMYQGRPGMLRAAGALPFLMPSVFETSAASQGEQRHDDR